MRTSVIKIDPDSPRLSDVKKAARLLHNGKIAAVPTETVYGLAVNAKNKDAVKRLYDIKNRPQAKPFTIQIAEFSQLKDYIKSISPQLKSILERFWPGPLTVIINTKNGKVGLRMPANKVTLAIINEAGIPLAVTSANLSGEEALSCASEVAEKFSGKIDLIVDDGKKAQGIESTVLDCTVSPFKILRKGVVAEELEEFIADST